MCIRDRLGSGGKAVGEAVAARLGIGVYDKQLINLAAEQSLSLIHI